MAVNLRGIETDEVKHHAPPYNVALVEGQRKIWFASRDLTEFSHGPSRDTPVAISYVARKSDGVWRLIDVIVDGGITI